MRLRLLRRRLQGSEEQNGDSLQRKRLHLPRRKENNATKRSMRLRLLRRRLQGSKEQNGDSPQRKRLQERLTKQLKQMQLLSQRKEQKCSQKKAAKPKKSNAKLKTRWASAIHVSVVASLSTPSPQSHHLNLPHPRRCVLGPEPVRGDRRVGRFVREATQ